MRNTNLRAKSPQGQEYKRDEAFQGVLRSTWASFTSQHLKKLALHIFVFGLTGDIHFFLLRYINTLFLSQNGLYCNKWSILMHIWNPNKHHGSFHGDLLVKPWREREGYFWKIWEGYWGQLCKIAGPCKKTMTMMMTQTLVSHETCREHEDRHRIQESRSIQSFPAVRITPGELNCCGIPWHWPSSSRQVSFGENTSFFF